LSKMKKAWELYAVYGRTYEQIAEELSVSHTTARTWRIEYAGLRAKGLAATGADIPPRRQRLPSGENGEVLVSDDSDGVRGGDVTGEPANISAGNKGAQNPRRRQS